MEQASRLRRLDIEHDNMRAALAWALQRQNGELAQRLGGALSHFWIHREHFDEGRRWLEQAMLLEAGVSPTIRASTLLGLGRIAYRQGDDTAEPTLEEALALFRATGDSAGMAQSLAALGMLLADKGDFARASALEEEALAIFEMLGDQEGVVRLFVSQGLDAYDQGDYNRATTLLEQARSQGESLGLWRSVAHALNNLALVAQEYRDFDRAVTLQAEALELWRGLGNMTGIADSFENLAMFTCARSEPERAVRLFAAADALRARIGVPGRPSDREYLKRFITAARTDLGEQTFAAAWAVGAAMSLDAAISHALGEDRE
jgi:tetratricopeptide (TPR) repeat protein